MYVVSAYAQHFVKNRARHRPEAVPAYFILAAAHGVHSVGSGLAYLSLFPNWPQTGRRRLAWRV